MTKRPKVKESTNQQLPPAVYGSIIQVSSTDRDVYLSVFQPLLNNNLNLVSRIAMPIETAKELKEILERQLSKK